MERPVHVVDVADIAPHHSPFFVIQNFGSFKQVENKLFSKDGDEGMAVLDGLGASQSRQLSTMRGGSVTKRVSHILNLVYSDPRGHALVSSSVKAAEVNHWTHFFVITPECLKFIVLLLCCMQGAGLRAFWAQGVAIFNIQS